MNAQRCLVCEHVVRRSIPPRPSAGWDGARLLAVDCEQCGVFAIDEGLLACEWRMIAPGDKKTLSV
jgi:hypothetical protein